MPIPEVQREDIRFEEGKTIGLVILSWSNAVRTVRIRGFTRHGLIVYNHVTNGDRSVKIEAFRIPDFPLALMVFPLLAPVRRGELFVKIDLRQAEESNRQLCSGYITSDRFLSYPHGPHEGSLKGPGLLRSITGTDPAAGAEISETVPTNARWRIKSLIFTLVTDGTVANRLVKIVIDDGANALSKGSCGNYQTASQTYVYTGGAGLYPSSLLIGYWNIVLPEMPILLQGWRIRTETDTIQAGDNYGAPQLLVEEWIEE